MSTRYALVLACDLTPDGAALGPQTILRLERGLRHANETGDRLVVAATYSPRHPNQSEPMAELMATWLMERGCENVCVLRAPTFRTKGELAVFLSLPAASVIISDPVHLARTRALIERVHGPEVAERLEYVPTEAPAMSRWGQRLEPMKLWYVRHVPLSIDDAVWRTVTWVTVRLRINLSY